MTTTVDDSHVALVRFPKFGEQERQALAAHVIFETFGGTRPQPDSDGAVDLCVTLAAPSEAAACVRIMRALDGLASIWPPVEHPFPPDDGRAYLRVCWHIPGALAQCRVEART